MNCTSCNAIIPDDSIFCKVCGKEQQTKLPLELQDVRENLAVVDLEAAELDEPELDDEQYIYSFMGDTGYSRREKNRTIVLFILYILIGCSMIPTMAMSSEGNSLATFFFPIIVISFLVFLILYIYQVTKIKKRDKRINPERYIKATLVKTYIVHTGSQQKAGSSIARGIVGESLFGTAGAIGGAMSAKSEGNTTFLLLFDDETRRTETVLNNSRRYQEYIQYLDVD